MPQSLPSVYPIVTLMLMRSSSHLIDSVLPAFPPKDIAQIGVFNSLEAATLELTPSI